jgi:endo-1,3(4)-beta-glucanase
MTSYAIPTNLPQVDHPIVVVGVDESLLSKKIPTHSFWTNFILGDRSAPISQFPSRISLKTDGYMAIASSPQKNVTATYITTNNLANMSIKIGEVSVQPIVSAWSPMTVTLSWRNANVEYMNCTIVLGSPIFTFNCVKPCTLDMKTIHAITSSSSSSDKKSYTWTMNNGQTWKAFFSGATGPTCTFTTNTIKATPYSGQFILMDKRLFSDDLIAEIIKAPVTSSNVTVSSLDAHNVKVTIDWIHVGPTGTAPYLLALPHHIIEGELTVASNVFNSIRGQMRLVKGAQWVQHYNIHPDFDKFNAPRAPDDDKKADIDAAWEAEKNMVPTEPANTYESGIQLAKLARLILIGFFVLNKEVTSLVDRLTVALDKWVNNTRTKMIYERRFGCLLPEDGLTKPSAYYGLAHYLNDTVFHMGYFVYAAAVLAKVSPAWLTTPRKQWVEAMLNSYGGYDVNNPNFPLWRNKDWYLGHSIASGLCVFGDSKNLESSSEAYNGYYAMLLWSLATSNTNMAVAAKALLASDIQATQLYWHIPKDSTIYEEPMKSTRMGSIVWSAKTDAMVTFFGKQYCYGIQNLPVTPITELVWTPKFAADIYDTLEGANATLDPSWLCFHWQAQAIINKAEMWNRGKAHTQFHHSQSKTAMLYWIATRPDPSKPVPSVTGKYINPTTPTPTPTDPVPIPNVDNEQIQAIKMQANRVQVEVAALINLCNNLTAL